MLDARRDGYTQDLIDIMAEALEQAWNSLRAERPELEGTAFAQRARQSLAIAILEGVKHGMHDPARLSGFALSAFAAINAPAMRQNRSA